jgi:hypothetical protein
MNRKKKILNKLRFWSYPKPKITFNYIYSWIDIIYYEQLKSFIKKILFKYKPLSNDMKVNEKKLLKLIFGCLFMTMIITWDHIYGLLRYWFPDFGELGLLIIEIIKYI